MVFCGDFGTLLFYFTQVRDHLTDTYDDNQSSPTSSTRSSLSEVTDDQYSSDQLASVLQLQFDEEDRRLAAERAELVAAAAAEELGVFNCGMCMSRLPEESIARIEPCQHSFCRECVRELIVSQIESRRFPVLCPTCSAGPLAGSSRPESIGSYVSLTYYF